MLVLVFLIFILVGCCLFYQEFLARPKIRNFIKLDSSGICIACLRCSTPPSESWLEVGDFCVTWLGQKPKL